MWFNGTEQIDGGCNYFEIMYGQEHSESMTEKRNRIYCRTAFKLEFEIIEYNESINQSRHFEHAS